MPVAIFIVHLDDYQGFVVEKRYPSTLTLTEKILNLVFYDRQKGKKEELKFSEIEGLNIASFSMSVLPNWMVCFVLGPDEEMSDDDQQISGMGRLILQLVKDAPDSINLEDILTKESVLLKPNEEQNTAEVFLTPSSALVLEKMESEGVESAAKLSIWLKNQIQSDNVDIREAIAPLVNSGIVAVELIGKTKETVFLLKDVFGYRAPPVEAMKKAGEVMPETTEKYREFVTNFFSPPPPNKGYNPTIPVSDPNSPIIEDREKLASMLSNSIQYGILKELRKKPQSIEELAVLTAFPDSVVQNALWALESERVVVFFEREGIWGLVTNPLIESFMPEFVLPMISKKMVDKEILPETAQRYLELLTQTWSERID
ncbi:MAG: hypothetical protein ACXADL_07820 [Candidatus Thorarchaeota archaeon]|jgi:hypothetical protein